MAALSQAELAGLYREVAQSLNQLAAGPFARAPALCARRLIQLGESQTPGEELRALFITAAAVALLGAVACGERDAARQAAINRAGE